MRASPVASRLDPLVHALYDCTEEDARWNSALDLIGGAFGARSAVVQVLGPRDGQLRTCWHRRDSLSERSRELHEAVLPDEQNPRLKVANAALRRRVPVVRDADLFSGDRHSLAELRSRLAALQLGAFMGGALPLDGDRYVTLALHRDLADRGGFHGADQRLLEQLLPHLRRATAIALRLESEQRRNSVLAGALDQLDCGVMICNAEGQAVWVNATAAQWFFVAGPHAAAQSLPPWLRKLAGRFPARELQWRSHEDLQLLLCPVPGVGETLVFASRRTSGTLVPETLIARIFGLTPAESALVAALCAGRPLEAHALARGVALGTVRSQLKHVLRKTQCSRQGDLLRVVLSSIVSRIRHD